MDRLSEIRARCDEATPGPWKATFGMDCRAFVQTPDKAEDFKIYNHANAAFIAHAREDIPYLLSKLDKMTARAEKAEAENRWIPVNKRLPKITEYRNENRYKSMDSNELVPFLVCCKDTEIPFRAFYDGKNWGDGWNKLKVTHWMPLPEMPKEESTP